MEKEGFAMDYCFKIEKNCCSYRKTPRNIHWKHQFLSQQYTIFICLNHPFYNHNHNLKNQRNNIIIIIIIYIVTCSKVEFHFKSLNQNNNMSMLIVLLIECFKL